MSNDDLSRRDALSGGAAAVLAGVGAALAVSTAGRDAQAQSAGDITALNNLLRAEYELQQAYDIAIGFMMAAPTSSPDDPMRMVGPTYARVIQHYRGQHANHAMRLRTLIQNFQGTPISDSTVVFTPPPAPFTRTVVNFLRLACNREKAAALAYTNALKTLGNANAAELAAAVGAVETQHFIALYLLLKNAVIPSATLNMDTVIHMCPVPIVNAEGASPADTFEGVETFTYMP